MRLKLIILFSLVSGFCFAQEPRTVESRVNAGSEEWTEYEVETVDALKGFRYRKADPETDVYGGWMTGRQEATGFFRIQKIDGRWWFIDPDGYPYIFKGVAVFSMGGSDRQKEALESTFGTPGILSGNLLILCLIRSL